MVHPIITTAHELKDTTNLINRFPINNGLKTRWVNDPIPQLKVALKDWNVQVTNHYVQLLEEHQLTPYSQAYLPKKSIVSNAKIHQNSEKIIKFDFTDFYGSVSFDYIKEPIQTLTNASEYDLDLIKRLIIDPKTDGVTQGLPVSGALAGIALIPFWETLRNILGDDIMFTQYSDDLTFSAKNSTSNPLFNVEYLTMKIYSALEMTNLDFKLNGDKTTTQEKQFRKITGVRINHKNQLTCSREDYRKFRTITHVLSKNPNTEKVLNDFGFKSRQSFIGKISNMRSIDETGKINRLIDQNADTFLKHNLFKSWIVKNLALFG